MTDTHGNLTRYDMPQGVTAFSTTRHGGVSSGNHASFNINEYCGDTPVHVAANRRILAAELGIAPDHIVMPHQTHGTGTRIIGSDFPTLPEPVRRTQLEGIDAVMTDAKGVCIGVSTADCIPVLLYDTRHHAACAVHAGWRGTLARITHKAVADMQSAYHTDPAQLKAVIGPGISLDNFEVGDEVYDAFKEAAFDMGAIAAKRAKWHIDLPLANRLLLKQAGLADENIVDTGICTYANADTYFSARRLGIESGRIFTGILMQ